ncbi:Parkinson disease protein 7 homolog [Cloeon dipterum]|uniref:Parkinson disease protein 7 homolog n=1 Tax=Cloeon dipterum TaxID=197152 RepID=UPI00321F88BC
MIVDGLRVLVLIAQGISTTELIPVADMLRRVRMEVVIAGIDGPQALKADSNMNIVPDNSLDDALKRGPFNVIVIPGMEQSAYLVSQNQKAKKLVQEHVAQKKLVGALGAGCLTLMEFGVGKGKRFAASPGFIEVMMSEDKKKEWKFVKNETVVIDGNFITSHGMWTAMDFAFDLIEKLRGKKEADTLADFVLHIRHRKNATLIPVKM